MFPIDRLVATENASRRQACFIQWSESGSRRATAFCTCSCPCCNPARTASSILADKCFRVVAASDAESQTKVIGCRLFRRSKISSSGEPNAAFITRITRSQPIVAAAKPSSRRTLGFESFFAALPSVAEVAPTKLTSARNKAQRLILPKIVPAMSGVPA